MIQQRAFIFDMDGTIVDNMGFHTRSWLEFFSRRGHAVDEAAFFAATAGRTGHEIMRQYLGEGLAHDDVTALIGEKEVLYREIYAPHLRAVEGFGALVNAAQAAGIRLAVGTAAPPCNVDFTLDGLGVRELFDTVVGAADVKRGKPEPDVFLLAAERCGADPAHCIVFEDAPLGVEAARRAGMRCVVLTTTLPAEAFKAFDNVICIARDFSEIDINTLTNH
ncbi:HAD family phosphatase [Duganella sp. Root198D2]|uniref:HAD family hydrolase n=1 Tax=Duganella sp. Root198D2 TaxID=1736489 RepID=UPI0007103DF7|nr:HAD family phosphatase [Duganella sp. Root198D2]KRC01477.1 beta-phosphoglucomutase [Duganella sp. Root198D2]